jgi:hypothetical protein
MLASFKKFYRNEERLLDFALKMLGLGNYLLVLAGIGIIALCGIQVANGEPAKNSSVWQLVIGIIGGVGAIFDSLCMACHIKYRFILREPKVYFF